MTPQEFKAWFEGFTEAFDGRIPTKAQWQRIQKRVEEIDGNPITERTFIDRYWPTYVPYYTYTTPVYNNPIRWQSVICNTTGTTGATYNATSAMYSLGVLDAQAASAGA